MVGFGPQHSITPVLHHSNYLSISFAGGGAVDDAHRFALVESILRHGRRRGYGDKQDGCFERES